MDLRWIYDGYAMDFRWICDIDLPWITLFSQVFLLGTIFLEILGAGTICFNKNRSRHEKFANVRSRHEIFTNFQVGGAHTPGGSLRGFLPSLLDRRSASRRGCRSICSGRLMGMCLRCARCSTVSLKTLPEKAPRRFHFRSKFQVKTFQVEIFARTLVQAVLAINFLGPSTDCPLDLQGLGVWMGVRAPRWVH